MTGFTDEQIAALRAPLSRDHVKSRSQAGRTLSYVEGWHIINEANRIFGFDSWDRETTECRCVTERETMMGANKDRPGWRVAYVGRVRVTVRAGGTVIVREGTGYGSGIDADLGEAHESAIKECETDSTKRAMMTFGNQMGLALYDKAQAEVEARPAATRTPPRQDTRDPFNDAAGKLADEQKPAPPPVSTVNGTAPKPPSPAREADHARAVAIRDRVRAAIEAAQEPVIIDEILRVNRVDLEFVLAFHDKTYNAILAYAAARSNELRASA